MSHSGFSVYINVIELFKLNYIMSKAEYFDVYVRIVRYPICLRLPRSISSSAGILAPARCSKSAKSAFRDKNAHVFSCQKHGLATYTRCFSENSVG